MYTLYAAGPIAGQSYDGACEWRAYVALKLSPDVRVLSPMRGKEFLRTAEVMPLTGDGFPVGELERGLSSTPAIVKRDTWDVARSDILLANFLPGDETNIRSIGTACEVYLASYLHKPVVSILTPGGIHDHPFIVGSSWVVVSDLSQGIRAVKLALNLPDTSASGKVDYQSGY